MDNSDYNLRQLHRMRQQLEAFNDGYADLGAVLANLITLLDAIELTNTGWMEEIDHELSPLHIILALAHDRGMTDFRKNSPGFTDEEITDINIAIAAIDRLLTATIDAV